MSTRISSTGYIVHNNEAIFGIGTTADEAWDEMVIGSGLTIVDEMPENPDDWSGLTTAEHLDDVFKIRAASARLLAEVQATGGKTLWCIIDGVACAPGERVDFV